MDGGDETGEILAYMLLGDQACRHFFTVGVGDRNAEDAFRLEDAMSVMAQGPMPKRRLEFFGAIEPVMDFLVVLRNATKTLGRALCVMKCVCDFTIPFVQFLLRSRGGNPRFLEDQLGEILCRPHHLG